MVAPSDDKRSVRSGRSPGDHADEPSEHRPWWVEEEPPSGGGAGETSTTN